MMRVSSRPGYKACKSIFLYWPTETLSFGKFNKAYDDLLTICIGHFGLAGVARGGYPTQDKKSNLWLIFHIPQSKHDAENKVGLYVTSSIIQQRPYTLLDLLAFILFFE